MTSVHAFWILAFVQSAMVTVTPTPEDACPSSAQVATAILTHAPRLMVPRPDANPAESLTLVMVPGGATGELSISLVDSRGRVRLYRTLPPPVADRARDCAALADTVAFILDRYFNEVELPALPERKAPDATPAPPPAPPKATTEAKDEISGFALSANTGLRTPGGVVDLGGIEFKLTLDADIAGFGRHGGRILLDMSGGLIGLVNTYWNNGSANALRAGADMALLFAWPTGRGRFYMGPLVSLEIIWLSGLSGNHLQSETLLGGAAGARLGYQHLWRNRLFARIDANGCVAVVRNSIGTQSRPSTPLFLSPPGYLSLSIGMGIWF